MPLTRYKIRNEYSLADPELYRAADKDDPEALLEGVAMAGLVGVLRQLGDLAEFAAEIFHDLHEEVMVTATRGHSLMVRVQQLEAEFPSIEKAFFSQTSHSLFFYNSGVDWHPNLRMDQNLIMQEDLPRFIMDSYEECRGPPRLFLLDKFDVAGTGACLKRYTNPSFFKLEASSSGMKDAEVLREKKIRKTKKKGSRWRNGETPDVLSASHAKLQMLFLEDRIKNGTNDPARLVKLKRRLNGFPLDLRTGKSYMEKFLETPSPEHEVVRDISVISPSLKLPPNSTSESGLEILEIGTVSPDKESLQRKRSPLSSPNIEETVLKPSLDELNEVADEISMVPKVNPNFEADNIVSTVNEVVDEREIVVDGESKIEGRRNGYQSDDIASEIDNYLDARTTMESEMETDTESRAKRDLGFFNIEKQGTDSDANEEQQELHGHFSDSQSLGNSTASDDGHSSSKKEISSFSYSDSLSNLPENETSDGDVSAKVFPSTEICEAEIIDMLSDQHSVKEEIPATQPPGHVVPRGVCIEVAEIPSYISEFGEPSSSSSVTDVAQKLSSLASSREDSLVGLELDEVSSNCNELFSGFISTKEDETNLGDNLLCTSNPSDVLSHTRDNFSPMVSAEDHPVDELDGEDPKVFSDASLHFSNRSRGNSLDHVLQTEYSEDVCTKNLVDGQIDFPHSVILHTGEPSLGSALPELENCDPDIRPDGIVSEVDDANPSTGKVAVKFTPVVDSPQTCNFIEQFSETTDDLPLLELDSEGRHISSSGERNLDGALETGDGEEMGRLTPNIDMVGKDAVPLEFWSDLPNSPDPASDVKDHKHVDGIVTGTAQPADVAVACAAVGTDVDDGDNENDVNTLSTNLKNLQEECLSSLGDSVQNGLENEAGLPEHLKQSGIEKEVDQQAVASPNMDSIQCNTVSSDHSYSELLNDVPYSRMAAEAENSLYLGDAITVSSSSDQSSQDSESKSPQQKQKVELQADQLNVESHYLGQDSESKSPWQSNLIEISEDDVSLPNHCLTVMRIPSEQKVVLQADQLDEESHRAGEVSSGSSLQLEEIQPPNNLDQGRCIDVYSEFRPAHPPSQPSVLAFLPQSGSHKLGISEQVTVPLSLIFPDFGLIPEATQINLEEMPPLPPLPPVQWRMGKTQHGSLASERDLVQRNLGPFPPILPSTADEIAQLFYPVKGEITQLSDPFLQLSAVRDENTQRAYVNLADNMMHSSQFPLQVPTMIDHGKNQDDFLTSSRTQSTNLFLTLPAIYNERPQHDFLALGGGTVQPNMNPSSTVTSENIEGAASTCAPKSFEENMIQPQLAPETSSEDMKLQSSGVNSEVKVVDHPDTPVSPPRMEDEQPQHVFPTSEGETVWSSSTSTLLPAFEDGKQNGNWQLKLPRPRNPLIDAVAAHDKSKMRKVTERVFPQIGQKVDERDSLLEQIRTKSFNLKPALAARPSIQGPKTNLKVAAILEKANSIRQALAGSDEDDDVDSWSDS
ncbi:hypothetical protein F0562_017781 [Nyssa sinensis]|uniref:Protein SCAR n=1 Tax=Nyssa sinensis TaxID=561372 RepID=A0A5J4ZIZ9_9ASTE|nr:hypothetical protein F0562_017781 [Nyssa sinensis]